MLFRSDHLSLQGGIEDAEGPPQVASHGVVVRQALDQRERHGAHGSRGAIVRQQGDRPSLLPEARQTWTQPLSQQAGSMGCDRAGGESGCHRAGLGVTSHSTGCATQSVIQPTLRCRCGALSAPAAAASAFTWLSRRGCDQHPKIIEGPA